MQQHAHAWLQGIGEVGGVQGAWKDAGCKAGRAPPARTRSWTGNPRRAWRPSLLDQGTKCKQPKLQAWRWAGYVHVMRCACCQQWEGETRLLMPEHAQGCKWGLTTSASRADGVTHSMRGGEGRGGAQRVATAKTSLAAATHQASIIVAMWRSSCPACRQAEAAARSACVSTATDGEAH